MLYLKKIIFLLSCIYIFPLQAVFYTAERFVNMQGNSIVCFGDIHIPCENSNIPVQQQKEVLQYAANSNAYVIVEDMDSRYGKNPLTAGFEFNSYTPLDQLSTLCSNVCIECNNVEFRESSAASLAGLPIAGHQTLCSFRKAVQEVLQYNDGYLLNAYYWRTLSVLWGNHKPLIDELEAVDCSLQDYCQSLTQQEQERINLFDVPLIDARIMHAIHHNRFRPTILVCAGANHIQRIKPILLKMGYKSVGDAHKKIIINEDHCVTSCSALSIQDFIKNSEKLQYPYFLHTKNTLTQFGAFNNSSSVAI